MQTGIGEGLAHATETPRPDDRSARPSNHVVQFYEDDAFLLEVVDRFVGAALGAGDTAFVIATAEHRRALEEQLEERGLDVARAREHGRYRAFDARETLAEISIDGWPDEAAFKKRIGDEIAAAAREGRAPIHAFGEMVALLCADGKRDAAIRLEKLWNDLAGTVPFSLLCAYPMSAFDRAHDGPAFEAICEQHSQVLPDESYPHAATPDDRLRIVTRLQQKASALEAEALARGRAEASAANALQEVLTLYRVGQLLTAELDLERLLQALTDAATRLTGAQFGAFFYNALDDQRGHYLLYTLSGAPREAFEKLGMPRNTAIFGPTFAGEGVVRLDDVERDPRYGLSAPHHGMPPGHLPVTSYLAAPVVGRSGEVFGGLFLGHAERAVFTEASERIVVGLASQAAIALDNARLFAAARRAQDEAETASRAKDEFLSVVSHELRTPLASMLGWAGFLKTLPLAERGLRAVETIERSGRAQAKLIEELLDVSRIIGGQMRLDLQLVDLTTVVRAALETIRPTADAKGVHLDVDLGPAGAIVAGDAERLQQVAWNLLSNAVKFTPAGGTVAVVIDRQADEIRLRVDDTGRGIAAEFLPFVFDRFRQSENVVSRRLGGLGLGLAIVRHLVELHGGAAEVASDGEGRGATFTITFPLSPSSAQADPNGGAGLLEAVRVLVIDDDGAMRDRLRTILEAHGARVTAVDSVPKAREVLQRSALDILISDVRLRDEDEEAAAGPSRGAESLRSMPAIALTGSAGDDARRALAAGYQVHLGKPVDPELLVSAIRQLATAERAKRAAACTSPTEAS